MFCENCGNKLSENAKFCDNCGNNVSNNSNNNTTSTSQGINSKNKKNYTLYIIGGIILFFVSLFLVPSIFSHIYKGFSSISFKSDKYEYSVDDVIVELSERYHENFEYVHFYSDPFGATYDSFYITSKDKSSVAYNKNIYVKVENFKSKNRTVYDGYLLVKFNQEIKDFFKNKIEKQFNQGTIVCLEDETLTALTNGLNYSTTFNDYLKVSDLFFYAIVKESDFKDLSQIEEVVNSIATNFNDLYFSLYVVKDDYYSLESYSNLNSNLYLVCHSLISVENGIVSIKHTRASILKDKYEEQLKNYLNENFKQYFPTSKLDVYNDTEEELFELDKNSSFEEYLKNKNTSILVKYKMKKEEYDKDKLDLFVDKLVNAGLEFRLVVEVYSNDESFYDSSKYDSDIKSLVYNKELGKELEKPIT